MTDLRPSPTRQRRRLATTAVAAVAVVFGAPLLYLLARSRMGSDTAALTVCAAASVIFTATAALRRPGGRWVGLLAVAGLGLALIATVLSNGSSLPLKVYRPVATAVAGLAMLLSAAAGRPLLLDLVKAVARRHPEQGARAMERLSTDPAARRRLTTLTVMVGAAFVIEAAVTITLAVTTSTTTFLVASRAVRWGVGAVVVLFTVWRFRHRTPPRPSVPGEPVAPRVSTPWFARRSSGLGVRPQTWRGWAVVAVVIAALVVARLVLSRGSQGG